MAFSPALKGQQNDPNRYGVFGQQPSQVSTSQDENKENMPEVSWTKIIYLSLTALELRQC